MLKTRTLTLRFAIACSAMLILSGCSTTEHLWSLEDAPPTTVFEIRRADGKIVQIRDYTEGLDFEDSHKMTTIPGRIRGTVGGFAAGVLTMLNPQAWTAGAGAAAGLVVFPVYGFVEGAKVCGLDMSPNPFSEVLSRVGAAPIYRGIAPEVVVSDAPRLIADPDYILALDELGMYFGRADGCAPVVRAYADWYLGERTLQQECEVVSTIIELTPRPESYAAWWPTPEEREASVARFLEELGRTVRSILEQPQLKGSCRTPPPPPE